MKKYSTWLISGVAVAALVFLLWYIFQPDIILLFSATWVVLIATLLWVGNKQLTIRLDKFLPWSRYGNWRFFIQLLAGLVYLLFLINLIYYIIKITLTNDPPTWEQMIVVNLWGAVLFIPLFSLYFSLHFLRHWRTSELAAEKNQRENMRAQLNSLKNHLDPHFLFNNLNILSSLIDKDQKASKVFIQKFADVYRSLLRTKSDDLIPLSEELTFVQAYMYLIGVRFGEHIVFNTTVNSSLRARMIPPLTLQMLLENAVKHNLISETQALQIDITEGETNYLVVRNTLNTKTSTQAMGEGTGLTNIQQRYSHFTDLPVKIIKTTTHFEVHIPLLEMENV